MSIKPNYWSLTASPSQQHQKEDLTRGQLGTLFLKNFVYGGTAGAIGLSLTFPIDLAKTRLQQQVSISGQQAQYKNVPQTILRIFQKEGFASLFRGLPTSIPGIMPEKAIKLSVNDFMRHVFAKPDGSIAIVHEMLSGGIAAAPYELLKIRMQEQGALPKEQRMSPGQILKQIGLRKLFTGSGATLLRDVPFNAFYFAGYGRLKLYMAKGEDDSFRANWFHDSETTSGVNSTANMTAGILAGAIASWACTPADVIKTRLQSQTRLDISEHKYSGIVDCFKKTVAEEGSAALFKGASARVGAIAPLFGITLTAFEWLQQHLGKYL